MEMADCDVIEVFELRTGLTEAEEGTPADVDENAGLAIEPNEIRRRCTRIICNRAARAEYLQRDARR